MANGFLVRLFWRALDAVDYSLTLAMLWTVDALYDPDPDGPGNHRGIDRRLLEEADRGDTQLSRGWSLPRHKRPFVRSVPTIRANRRGRLLTEIAPPTV
jgi:hypothetical protein